MRFSREIIYISTDSIIIKTAANRFSVKGTCMANVKKEFRNMYVILNTKTVKVIKAENSGYIKHVIACLFNLADYSLDQLKIVSEEVN